MKWSVKARDLKRRLRPDRAAAIILEHPDGRLEARITRDIYTRPEVVIGSEEEVYERLNELGKDIGILYITRFKGVFATS